MQTIATVTNLWILFWVRLVELLLHTSRRRYEAARKLVSVISCSRYMIRPIDKE